MTVSDIHGNSMILLSLEEYERLKKYDVESIETKEVTVYGNRYLRVADGLPDDITGKELKRLADDINCGSVLWVNGKGNPMSYTTQENDYIDVKHIKDDYFLFTQKDEPKLQPILDYKKWWQFWK